MSLQLNRAERLIDEDLEWLRKQPRTLEREHIDLVLQHARERYLGGGAWEGEPPKPDGDAQAEEARRVRLLPKLAEALREALSEVEGCRGDCSDPWAECFLQDYGKDYHSLTKLRALLAEYDEAQKP